MRCPSCHGTIFIKKIGLADALRDAAALLEGRFGWEYMRHLPLTYRCSYNFFRNIGGLHMRNKLSRKIESE